MSKNSIEHVENFDGVTYQSYDNENNWWDASGAQGFLNARKMVIIISYNENNCNQVYADYMGIYNRDLSYLCEDATYAKYAHYNDD